MQRNHEVESARGGPFFVDPFGHPVQCKFNLLFMDGVITRFKFYLHFVYVRLHVLSALGHIGAQPAGMQPSMNRHERLVPFQGPRQQGTCNVQGMHEGNVNMGTHLMELECYTWQPKRIGASLGKICNNIGLPKPHIAVVAAEH
ncbi:uncharacterized protein LOC142557031 [Dermacentor variabilis]|uniref:uncharacterized protein LOC142557031 n=1 Tax=Dermacentor variabilis TaxID=34621 RepID=UPI003F5C9706